MATLVASYVVNPTVPQTTHELLRRDQGARRVYASMRQAIEWRTMAVDARAEMRLHTVLTATSFFLFYDMLYDMCILQYCIKCTESYRYICIYICIYIIHVYIYIYELRNKTVCKYVHFQSMYYMYGPPPPPPSDPPPWCRVELMLPGSSSCCSHLCPQKPRPTS